MARKVVKRGRVTEPKKVSVATGRYTPPIPREYKESPRWVPIAMFTLLALGMIIIIGNYLELWPGPGILPEAASNAYLLIGLGFITAGFIVATRWR